jgi:uncharacterized protein (TIGR03790 family)
MTAIGIRLATVFSAMLFVAGWNTQPCHAGGSGYNTLLVINRASSNSCEVGSFYREARGIPPENVVFIDWTGGNVSWTSNDFQSVLAQPILTAITNRGLSNQAFFVVLSMDIPYKTIQSGVGNGTTSALFYGLRPDASGAYGQSYFASELPLEKSRPSSATNYSFLAAFLTAECPQLAMDMTERGASADGSFPSEYIALVKSSDPIRNLRHPFFDNPILNASIIGHPRIYRTNSETPWITGQIFGMQTGLANYSAPAGAFAAGAIADSMTSFGGALFENTGQTTLLEFIKAGASASYGTVSEPGADLTKFPNPLVYSYQARGFNMAESYYMSLLVPYQGIIVGDPLVAPFQHTGSGFWTSTNFTISGSVPMGAHFSGGGGQPLDRVDLFMDGRFHSAVTNLGPSEGNVIETSINGYPLSYNVPAQASIQLIAADLAQAINSVSNLTQVCATNFGDRIELRMWATNQAGRAFFHPVPPASQGSVLYYRATLLPDPIPPLVEMRTSEYGPPAVSIQSPGRLPYILQATTNFIHWQPVYTNASGQDALFTDPAADELERRFYRAAGVYVPPQQTVLRLNGYGSDGARVEVLATNAGSYILQGSIDFLNWTGLVTNSAGTTFEFLDTSATNLLRRFYRTAPTPIPQPVAAPVEIAPGEAVIKVDNAVRPYSVDFSTNMTTWTPLTTNLMISDTSLTIQASKGGAPTLTTFASAAQPKFALSSARGAREYGLQGNAQTNSYIRLYYVKTNGDSGRISVTNTSGLKTLQLGQILAEAVRTNANLSGPDGLEITDVFTNSSGRTILYIQSRSSGREAAAVMVQMSASTGIMPLPGGIRALDENLAVLEPRNHIYISAGLGHLTAGLLFDTTILPDGFHDFSFVAYEGTHVRTQTRTTQSVVITNTPLAASIAFVGGITNFPVSGSAQVEVTANTNNVSRIQLFTTGGLAEQATNTSQLVASLRGTNFGVGLHPVYALVETTNGWRFRTETRLLRFSK